MTARDQRTALGVLCFVLSIYLLTMAVRHPVFIPDPAPQGNSGYELKIDPNTAPWEMLALLPDVGETRARQIISYRVQWATVHAHDAAFKTPEDLMRVKGFGAVMSAKMRPHLIFPKPDSATTRAS